MQGDILDSKNKNFITSVEGGVPQGSTIGPLFINILLNDLKEAAFSGLPGEFNRNSKLGGTNVSNHCLSYADDIVFIYNVGVLENILENIKNFLKSLGLRLNERKTKIIKLCNKKLFFDHLGFRFLYVPIAKLKLGGLLQKQSQLAKKQGTKEPGKLLITIAPSALTAIKKKLKLTIRASYNLSVPQLIDKLNPIIRGFGNYFN